MSAIKSHVITWAVNLLECLPNVDLHGYEVEAEHIPMFNPFTSQLELVPTVTLSIRPAGYAAAEVLADSLELRESEVSATDDGYGLLARHTWAGWVPDASHEVAVRVEMTATERLWLDDGGFDDLGVAA